MYGGRFGKQTDYLMLDIDRGSLYHPHSDRLVNPRLLAALEPLGLVEAVAVTSSYRGGIHLYLPFQNAQETWTIAQVVSTWLANAGFKLKPEQLELFPNPQPYSAAPSLYAAHRLPLQAGSYLLNRDFQPIYGERTIFVQRWQFAQQRNELDQRTLKRVLQQPKRQRYKLSGKAEKFLHDLNTDVLTGWTDSGQTNYLLGRIAMREYIFGHVQRGMEPLTGEALVDAICAVARSLPGFEAYCSHPVDLEQRAMFYTRSIQSSHYYPFGSKHQAKTALPPPVTARRQAIKAYGIGNSTLDKYKELWHPNHLKPSPEGQYHTMQGNKLVPHPAAPPGQAVGSSAVGGSGFFSIGIVVKAAHRKSVRAEQQLAKMQGWLASGDRILVAEASNSLRLKHSKNRSVSSVRM